MFCPKVIMALLACIFLARATHGSESERIESNQCLAFNDEVFSDILSSQDPSILGYLGGKVYFCQEKIHLTENGMFLKLKDGNYFVLPSLQFDKNGYFILSEALSNVPWLTSNAIWDYWRCSKGHLNEPWSIRCGVPTCREPRYYW